MSNSRRFLIAGNWKMNGLVEDSRALASGLAERMRPVSAAARPFDMLICPPFPLLSTVAGAIRGSGIALGGQDCHMAEKGAHTGDVSPLLLKDVGCAFVIVGHSERRADHAESNETVKAKAEAAQAAGLVPVICIGETLDEREAGHMPEVVRGQLRGSLPDGATAENTVIAYEPVWAIGTGRTASPEQAQEVHALVRGELEAKLGAATAQSMRILYGGSMNAKNAAELLGQPDVDGGLIGGASLKVDDFWTIAQSCL